MTTSPVRSVPGLASIRSPIGFALALVCSAVSLTSAQSPASARETAPGPTIAVVAAEGGLSPDAEAVRRGLVHLIQSELTSRYAARVVGRRHAALFLEELGMAAAELTESDTAQRFGRALDADYVVLVDLPGGALLEASVHAVDVVSDDVVRDASFVHPPDALLALAADIASALASALGLAPAAPPPTAEGPPPTLAVLDFRSDGPAGELDRHLSELGDLLSADLTALDVPLVERQRLNSVLDELGLSASGLARAPSLARVGHLLGAERVLDTSMMASPAAVILDSQLLHPESGIVAATCRVSGDRDRLPALIQQLAVAVAELLRVPVTEAARSNLAQRQTASLEAALHAAAGWRLGQAGRAEEAVTRFQRAVFLDPTVAWSWDLLGRQYQAMGDYESFAEAVERCFPAAAGKADPFTLSRMACLLADAYIWQGRPAESAAAARLAMHYHENQHGYYRLIHALAVQGKFEEARGFCEGLVGRRDVSHYRLVRAWDFLLGWFAGPVTAQRSEEAIAWELDAVSRALDVFADGGPTADIYLGTQLSNALLACGIGVTHDTFDLASPPAHVEEALALAHRMTSEFPDGVSIPGRGWFVVGVLEHKRGRGKEAAAAVHHCLTQYPQVNYDSGAPRTTAGRSHGRVYYLLGRVQQDLLSDAAAATEAYRQALVRLCPGSLEAQDALARLLALGDKPLPPARWQRRVGGLGEEINVHHRQRLPRLLIARGYDLRFPPDASLASRLASHGIQVLTWQGRTSHLPSAATLRSYVAGGGNLLVVLGSQPNIDVYGPLLATGSQSMDATLNWLLPAFDMQMNGLAREASRAQLLAGEAAVAPELEGALYSGRWFPLEATRQQSLLHVFAEEEAGPDPDIVIAAGSIGLGKIAVVTLRDWFPSADTKAATRAWESALLQGILDWFGKDELPRQFPVVAEHWAAARNLVAIGVYSGAVKELDQIDINDPSGPDARYWAGSLLADELGDTDGAARRWREVVASDGDRWLVRMANLRLGILAMRAGDDIAAARHLGLAAGDSPDRIWGQALLARGDLKLLQGEWLGAARFFRKVADELAHSEERFRALFGLAYALGGQQKPDAAERVYAAIEVEFGRAPLPADFEERWPDPWHLYYPAESRDGEPTVADAVAAARAQVGHRGPAVTRP